jgi:hypothetical protein
MVTRRAGFQKVYDLTERVWPGCAPLASSTEAEQLEWAGRTAFERLVLATPKEIADFWHAITAPFAYDGLLYLNAGRGGPLFALRPGAAGDISLSKTESANQHVVWSQARGGTYLPTPVAYEGGIYTLTETGILTRFDARTGKQTYKTRIDPAATAFTTSPWIYNGKLFCLSEEGQTFVIAAGETFKLLHVNELDEIALATPAIVGERLLVRTETKLYSIRSKK